MNQKGFVNIVLIVTLVIVMGVLGYVTLVRKSSQSIVPSQAPNGAGTNSTNQTGGNTTENQKRTIVFDPHKIKVGDKVGIFTASSVSLQTNPSNFEVEFVGEGTVTGKIMGVSDMTGSFCFEAVDALSKHLLPRIKNEDRIISGVHFCFSNRDFAIQQLQSKSAATVSVSNFTSKFYIPDDYPNRAKLIKVISFDEPPPTTTPSAFKNEYKSYHLGIEFKYPENWILGSNRLYSCLEDDLSQYISLGVSGDAVQSLNKHADWLSEQYNQGRTSKPKIESIVVAGKDARLITFASSGKIQKILTVPYTNSLSLGGYSYYFFDMTFHVDESITNIIKTIKFFNADLDQIAKEVQAKKDEIRFTSPQKGEKLTKGVPYTAKWILPKGFTVADLSIQKVDGRSANFRNPVPVTCSTEYSWKVTKITIYPDEYGQTTTWEVEPGMYKFRLTARAFGGTQKFGPVYYVDSDVFEISSP